MSDAPQLFDVIGSAKYLQGIGAAAASVNFIRNLIATGQIPHIRIGKKFYVTRQALDAWLSNHERRVRL